MLEDTTSQDYVKSNMWRNNGVFDQANGFSAYPYQT